MLLHSVARHLAATTTSAAAYSATALKAAPTALAAATTRHALLPTLPGAPLGPCIAPASVLIGNLSASFKPLRPLGQGQKRPFSNNVQRNLAGGSLVVARESVATLSDLLQQEDSLGGLVDSYNNRKSLESVMSSRELEQRAEAACRLERQMALKRGLSLTAPRRLTYVKFQRPVLANRISFSDTLPPLLPALSTKPPEQANTNTDSLLKCNAEIDVHLRLGACSGQGLCCWNLRDCAAVRALLAKSAALYVDWHDFYSALEPLVLGQMQDGSAADPGELQSRSNARKALETFCDAEAFAAVQGTHGGFADIFELLLTLCNFCSVEGDERIRVLLTPFILDKFRRAQIPFRTVDDLAIASAVEMFKGKYPFLGVSPECGKTLPTATAVAAAECAKKELFVDVQEEPWTSAFCHAGLALTFDDFARVCYNTPEKASTTTTSLLRLPLILLLRDLL
ncbi:uncharacterized protein LOC34618945 [Cyclospora cayetanensis]|uniref:Uncharacterized protein LOC34618945 n=1 Tax=Cyclospora cayetanensis TaxID=88456 RepID=A0A6P6S3T6_9EIME|nr:uncharacterized protein LOC34618945 [Cyclospora cayetanensis]